MFAKASVWTEAGATWVQKSINGDRKSFYGNVVPPVAVMGVAIALFWHWNASLFLALLAGGGSSLLFYGATQRKFSGLKLEAWLQSPQAPMVLSLGAGLGMLMLSYGALAVWQDLNSPWLALMLFTQELGIFSALGVAIWLILTRKNQPLYSFERCVAGLLHRDDLRRLMAVRQLATLKEKGQLTVAERSQAADYLHLLAQKEQNPLVCQAIQDSLGAIAPSQRRQLGESTTISARRIKTSVATQVRQAAMVNVE